jgi:hypothetical protein
MESDDGHDAFVAAQRSKTATIMRSAKKPADVIK